MRTLTIGSTTLELNSFSKYWDKVGGVYAKIEIPTTSISYEELKVLFKDNAEDLIVTEDDGSKEILSGFAELHGIKENLASGLYEVTQYCTGTALHLLNEARKQIETLQTENTDLKNVVNAQSTELLAQAEVIVLQGETIAIQHEQVAALMEASTSQLDAIDSIMTEVLPLVAQEAANIAVEQAMAAIAEETPDTEAQYYMEKEQEAYEEMMASETITEEN